MTESPTDHSHDDAAPAAPIEVRRNIGLSATVGGLAVLLAVAFAVRAFGGGGPLDWLCFGLLAVVALVHVLTLVDARAPLLVADEHGVRLRDGASWQGVAWAEIDCLEHLPRRGLFRDGHVLVAGYDDRQLIVPLTLATTVAGAERTGLSDALALLAAGRADVVEVVPGLDDTAESAASDTAGSAAPDTASAASDGASAPSDAAAAEDGATAEDDTEPTQPDDDRDTDEIAAVDSTAVRGIPPVADVDPSGSGESAAPEPSRTTVYPARVEYPSSHEPRGPQGPGPSGAGGAPTAAAGDTMTVVLDELALAPAAEPVIGPRLAAARERLRLTVDQLSERTRIRPHVIEAIEVDDFAPCGGDFYARGHLRTMARVLGVDAGDLVADYDERYADGPVDPRRVFESELATGVGGSIRGTRGGRNWSVLIAAVMAAVLVWSLARLLMGGPVPVGNTPVLNQSGGIVNKEKRHADTVELTLTAAGGGAQVQVRDGAGDVVFDGALAFGQSTELDLVPPMRIWASDGSVTAAMNGGDATALGETGQEVNKTLIAP